MWLMTDKGFYSVTRLEDTENHQVRARCREHLEALKAAHAELAGCTVLEYPTADYRWRIVAPSETVADVVASEVRVIDYPNFKNRAAQVAPVASRRGYLHALHEVWSVMYALQRQGR